MFKWILAVSIALFACNNVNCVINQEFRERALIYSKLIDCDYISMSDNNYTDFKEISSLKESQPDGYLIRFPFYVLGARDAHIILTETQHPLWEKDFAYEILLGGWGNTKAVIRKKKNNYAFVESEKDEVISYQKPSRVIVEISTTGHINVYLNDEKKPFLSAYDPNPIQIKYFAFGSWENSQVEFLYNCASETGLEKSNVITKELTNGDSSNLSEAPLDDLVAQCKFEEKWEHEYKNYVKVSDIKDGQPEGYRVRLPLYVHGARDAHVLLSTSDKVDLDKDDAYEIIIGGWKNTRLVVRKKDEVLKELKFPSVITDQKQTQVVIQVTKDGRFEIFLGDLLYKPILIVSDPSPIQINYVSFASNEGSRVLFFYNCPGQDSRETSGNLPPYAPLAEPATRDEEVLNSKCKKYEAWENKYSDWFKVTAVKDSQPDGFVLRLPFLVRGVRDASIVVSSDTNDDPKNSYEFIVGGWGNSRTIVRRGKEILGDVHEYNILDEEKPVKVVLEISNDGTIKVYTEHNPGKPLLVAKDPSPLTSINYFSFTAYYRDLKYYYDCSN